MTLILGRKTAVKQTAEYQTHTLTTPYVDRSFDHIIIFNTQMSIKKRKAITTNHDALECERTPLR